MNQITPDERKLIDQALAQGRVQRITTPPVTPTRARVSARRAKVASLARAGKTAAQIAEALSVDVSFVYADARLLGVKITRVRRRSSEVKTSISEVKAKRADRARQQIKDRRRFQDNAPPSGEPNRVVPASMTGTHFPSKVEAPTPGSRLLKCGRNNAKIGGDVLVGRLKGARIFTLTLEERATCPRSCAMWRTCYGNSMNHSTRWRHGPALESGLRREVADLCAAHEQVLIRLHVLGDFWSVEYVSLWADLLRTHANLTVFGFTAWKPSTDIGAAIVDLRTTHPQRFMIRTSGVCARWGSFTMPFDFREKTLGDAVTCPEQYNALEAPERKTHCGNCAICWSSDVPIIFKVH